MAARTPPWFRTILRNVHLLVATVATIAVATTGYLLWHDSELDRLSSLANDYHLQSSVNAVRAEEELRHLMVHVTFKTDYDHGSDREMGHRSYYDLRKGIGVVHQYVEDILESHRLHGGEDGEFLASKLKTACEDFKTASRGFSEPLGSSLGDIETHASRLTMALDQLQRFHIAAHGDLEAMMEQLGETGMWRISVFVALVLMLGFLVYRTILKTIRKALGQQHEIEEELRRSNEELRQFAYVASHDLNEPLNSVSGYVTLLATQYRGRLGSDADEYIGYTVEGVERMKALIRDLIAYHHAGKDIEAFAATDLNMAVEQALSNLDVRIEEERATVTHAPLPTLAVDPSSMIRVFQHLIGNALKFRDRHRPPEVHIGVEERQHEWVFSVRDNGIGIAEPFFDKIFVLFQRLHPRHDYPGTGIGLSLCNRIVASHGGRMWLQSTPGEGSTFYFTLPKERPHAVA